MRRHPRKRLVWITVGLLLLLVAAACGQKPGVADSAAGFNLSAGAELPEGFEVDESGNIINTETGEIIDPETGEVIGTSPEFDSAGGPSSGDDPSDPSGGSGPSGGSDPNDPSGGSEPGGGSADGVTNEVIKIGIHAPLTGAAPVPSDSVEKGKDLYFRWMVDKNQSLFGRRVEVILKNDQYNPSSAVAVCKEMVEQDKVFMLSGAAGTDQIRACAQYAASVGVPYVGAGVTEQVLDSLPNYFATTMTYPEQGPLLVDYLTTKLGAKGEKNGVVMSDTASFNDAHDAFIAAADDAGMPIDYDRRVSKNADTQQAASIVQDLSLNQIENVYVLHSPFFFLNMLTHANNQGYAPQWVGVGISMTFDTVTIGSCPNGNSLDGARFFSPFPAWIDRNKFDPDFAKAVEQFHPEERGGDDFMLLSWQGSKAIWDMLKLPGENLTRERFIYYLERARGLKSNLGPTLNFSPDDHFGADQVHVSEARCSDRRWHTIEDFVSDF